MTVFVSEWQPSYGEPNQMSDDADGGAGAIVEDDGVLSSHRGRAPALDQVALAYVDGVRRPEALLWHYDERSGQEVRGLAGAFAYGAVRIDGRAPVRFEACQVERVAVWAGAPPQALPAMAGGWRWRPLSSDSDDPGAPLRELERQMSRRERERALELAEKRLLTIVDGTLRVGGQHGPLRDRPLPIVGYVKSHHRHLLPPAEHARVPALVAEPGMRTSLFTLGEERLSAYLRVGPRSRLASPWAGVVRIEMFQSLGRERAAALADELAGLLPRFAGVPHRDPRAPQNLQPVGALERHLRRLMGASALATRAARDAVARMATSAATGDAA
ncbi:hypothetical protein [Haliangium ochraceum]|uniref:NurA domain-containing protein n=1 Tax=Haliangium ochraceum (strain DSM 14365 / JCM 11303 / SMP-2) TaxID=502025 RepID=D0LLB3_HALO1|nr:hypothetical protein [Haliangium ochraceum]ACY18609.1 conserved hypothetical protein [Haliangium ochraceum DSM 14365]